MCRTVLASLQFAVHSPVGVLDWALFRLLSEPFWAIPPVRGSSLSPRTGLLDYTILVAIPPPLVHNYPFSFFLFFEYEKTQVRIFLVVL